MFIGLVVVLPVHGGQHTGIHITCFNAHRGTIAAACFLVIESHSSLKALLVVVQKIRSIYTLLNCYLWLLSCLVECLPVAINFFTNGLRTLFSPTNLNIEQTSFSLQAASSEQVRAVSRQFEELLLTISLLKVNRCSFVSEWWPEYRSQPFSLHYGHQLSTS